MLGICPEAIDPTPQEAKQSLVARITYIFSEKGTHFHIKMPRKGSFRVVDKDHDEVLSYIEQLMNDESSNLANIGADQNDELESSTEKRYHELQSKEILEKEIASLKDKIDTIKEWIPIVKNQCMTFKSYVKPLFDFLTAKTIEAYHMSKNILLSLLVKFLRLAIPLVQELCKSSMPYFDQIASVTKVSLVRLGTLIKKISTFLVKILMERLNDLFRWYLDLEAAA